MKTENYDVVVVGFGNAAQAAAVAAHTAGAKVLALKKHRRGKRVAIHGLATARNSATLTTGLRTRSLCFLT